MGKRTVNIEGHIGTEDAPAAVAYINVGRDYDRFHCLCFTGPSLYGLGMWIPRNGGPIHAVGNLSEHDYDVEDVAEALRDLVAVAPSLQLKVHCGGDWESTACIATVTADSGIVTVGPPELETVGAGLTELGVARMFEIMPPPRGAS